MSIRRRDLITLLGGAALAWPLAARAQQQRVRRVAVFLGISENDPETQARLAALRRGLAAAGWNEGKNLHVDYYFAEGSAEEARSIAAEVVRSLPDLILANGTSVVAALKAATDMIPVVFAVLNDPVGQGFIQSLARPGGNITGFTFIEFDLIGKWLSMLAEASSAIQRSAVIFNPTTSPYYPVYLRSLAETQIEASTKISPAPVVSPDEIESIVAALARQPGGSLMVPPDPFIVVHRGIIIEAANRHRLPTISAYRQFAIEGGLMSYGPDTTDIFERSAAYVDRILKGANPGELPAQSPVKFDFYIDQQSAKALGLTLPQTLLALANEVIE